MTNASIIDNYPQCPKCSSFNLRVTGVVGMALVKEEKYIELNARCNECHRESYYFLDTKLEKRASVSKESDDYRKYAEKVEEV